MSRALPQPRLLRAADALCDMTCVGFAAWTLLCHVTVFLGGGLHQLEIGAAITLPVMVGVAALRSLRGRTGSTASEPTTAAVTTSQVPHWLTAAGALVGGALAVALAAGVDPLRLWVPATVFLVVAAVLALRRAPDPPEREGSRASAVVLWALAVAAALLTASLCRPDADDSLYVSMAVAAADSPSAPLLAGDPLHGVSGVRLDFPTYRLHSFELLAGVAAHLTGAEAMAWLHLVFPPLLAVLAVLAIGRVARRLAPRRWLWVASAVVVLLVGIGNAHNWYGNMAFVRLHQGKGALVTVLVPLLVAYGLELGDAPGLRTSLRLAAAAVAAVGLNATALWLAPAVALPAVLAALPTTGRAVRAAALAGLAVLYPLLLGAGFMVAMQSPTNPLRPYLVGLEAFETPVEARQAEPRPAKDEPAEVEEAPPEVDAPLGVPPELAYMVDRVFLGARLAVPCAIVLLCGWWLSPEPLVRRLHLLFAVVALALVVNPLIIGWVAAHVTGTHTSWRLMWVVPLPLLVALALTAPVARWPRRSGALLSVLLVLGFVALVSDHSVAARANETSIRPFRLKAPPELALARALATAAPRGATVVTPLEVAPWLTTLHHHPHPLVVRNQYLQPLRERLGGDNVNARRDMVWLVSRPDARPAQVHRFLLGLDRFQVEGVCFPSSAAHRNALQAGLTELGFRSHGVVADHEVWARTLPLVRPPPPRG